MAYQKRRIDIIRSFQAGFQPLLFTLSVLFFISMSPDRTVWAQNADPQQRERLLDEPFRLMMDQQVPTDKRALFDWGGWLRSSYYAVDENVARGLDHRDDGFHALRRQQLRLWGYFSIDQVHQFYARLKLDYLDWNHGTSFDHNDSDWEGANLERGWYDFRLSRAQWAYGQTPDEMDVALRIGRQYVELGTGLALSLPLDAVVAHSYYQNWQLTVLGAQSVPSTYNVDRSVPGNSKESRRYWGLQLNYHGCPDHVPFIYYLSQEDKDAGSVRDDQTFGYDSRYLGLGSRGRFWHRDLQYTSEFVAEFGKSFAYSDEHDRQNIHAWALDTELRYVMRDKRQSQIWAEYLLASGDPDRRFSPANTIGGNRAHTTDDSFVAWGFRDTGLVLFPRISNLGMVRLGGSTYPLPQPGMFERLKFGTNFYLYHKQQSEGAASDNLSIRDNAYLGSEWDFFANWRLTSDLAWMLRYGIFWPGDAFISQSERQLIFTGLTLNF